MPGTLSSTRTCSLVDLREDPRPGTGASGLEVILEWHSSCRPDGEVASLVTRLRSHCDVVIFLRQFGCKFHISMAKSLPVSIFQCASDGANGGVPRGIRCPALRRFRSQCPYLHSQRALWGKNCSDMATMSCACSGLCVIGWQVPLENLVLENWKGDLSFPL